jgi:hypothetical protein
LAMRKLKIDRTWFKSHKKGLGVTILIVVLFGALVAGIKNLNAPAVGSISQRPSSKAEVIDPYAQPTSYNGKYLSFTYPAHYRQVPAQKSASYLEVVNFYATNQTGKQISIGVIRESINDDSGVALRKKQPQTYTQEPRTKTGALVFSSTASGSEKTAFVSYQDKVATVSVSAPPGWDLTSDLETILSSLKWK